MKTRLITMDDVVYGNVLALSRGGGFAPIGAEAYFDGSTPPTGWLICDGSTKNISDYPDLANYFQSQHGSKSYYGGNGSTTFGVPKRCGMPDGCDYESTTEHIVGVDKDRKPIYARSFYGTLSRTGDITIAAAGTFTSVKTGIMDIKGWINVMASGGTPSSAFSIPMYFDGTYGCIPYVLSDGSLVITLRGYSSGKYGVTVNYTKTTDSAVPWGKSADKNGIFCIKTTVSGHIYSTTEQQVGVWIDNKTLYEKVVSTGGAVPSGATEIYRESFTGYDVIGYTKS